jgi:hypothetical protein
MFFRLINLGLILKFSFCSSTCFTQTIGNQCEIKGSVFYQNCVKYIGGCENEKANGLGKLFLNNGDIISGTFRDNLIQNNYMAYFFSSSKKNIYGPNKGSALNGPCVSVDYSNFVTLESYDMGSYKGSSEDYFLVNQPGFILNSPFCAVNQYDAKTKTCRLIPNSKNIIFVSAKEYNAKGDRKYWVTVVSLSDNKIVRNFGSFEKPLMLNNEPEFIGYTNGETPVYKTGGSYSLLNINTGQIQVVSTLPSDLLRKKQFDAYLTTKNYDGFVSLDKFILLDDSSYFKVFNTKVYDDAAKKFNPQFGSGCKLVHFNKNHEVILSKEFKDINIQDFTVDQFSNRIALSYRNIDSTFLSYFDLNSLSKLADVFSKKNDVFDKNLMPYQKFPGNVEFSKNGTYLMYTRFNRGTTLYRGTDLLFGVDGDVYGLNTDENVILTNNNGYVRAYDLDKKTLIWSYKLSGDYHNTSFFNPDNEMYIISGATTIQSFNIPSPLYSISEFKQNPEYIKKFNIPTTSNSEPQKNGQNVTSSSISSTSFAENSKIESCTIKFAKPKLNVRLIDNRVKCCYCNVNYADYGPGMSDEEFLRSATLDYLTEKLYLHLISVKASKEHMEADIIALSKYMQTIYPNALAAMANLDAGYALSIINLYNFLGAPSNLASTNVIRKKFSLNGKFCSPEHHDKCMESQACKCK